MSAGKAIKLELKRAANPEKARVLQRFFKTGPGQYGEGDRFLGVVMPKIRVIAAPHAHAPLSEIPGLLASAIHEERMAGVILLVLKAKRADAATLKRLSDFYLRHRAGINNWDLIDVSAAHVVGAAFHERDRAPLYRLAESSRMWDRRIAIISTFHFIRRADFGDTLRIAQRYLDDDEDLMHKATGWMLREVGKRDVGALERFLDRHVKKMPRTMLRYAIERFPEKQRLGYLTR